MTRATGFYWVKLDPRADWEVAQYCRAGNGYWWKRMGSEYRWSEPVEVEVDERQIIRGEQ